MGSDDSFVAGVNGVRAEIKGLAAQVLNLKQSLTNEQPLNVEDRGEVIANLMLTYRHLEDASMRLGKVIQARDGGVSVYDKATTVGA